MPNLLLLPALLLLSQGPTQEHVVQTRLREIHQAGEFPGATASVRFADGKSFSVAVGSSNLEAKTEMKPTDRMLAGSIGKTWFAATILVLLQQDKVSLDEKIAPMLPNEAWYRRLPNWQDLTLRMLLNHTSGIPEHVQSPEFVEAMLKEPAKAWKPEELLAFVYDKPALFAAGKDWSYADTNFIVAAHVVEQLSGKNIYQEAEALFIRPLGLKDTMPSTRLDLPGLITGYSMPNSPFKTTGPMIKDGKFVFNPQMEWAGGGYLSNSRDLAEWAFQLYSGKALGNELTARMLEGVPSKLGRDSKYGIGVQIRQTPYGISYGHGGWFPGYLSEMEHFPEKGASIAVQVNTDDFRKVKMSTHRIVLEIAKALFGPGKDGS